MAVTCFVSIKVFSRAKGGRATRAAAYRAGERIRDERTGEVHNWLGREDVAHKEIVLPQEFEGCAEVGWARDRATLWNAAEFAGKACNARVAREVLVHFPPEFSAEQRVEVARNYARAIAEKYRCAVDTTIHTPRPDADERHHHAHLLMTHREITPRGLGRLTALEAGGAARAARGITNRLRDDYLWVRKQWAHVNNEALRQAGLTIRMDPRSLKAQGIDREPKPHIPRKIYYAERKTGRPTPEGDAIRAAYHERVEARRKGPEELARVVQRQRAEDIERRREYGQQIDGTPRKKSWGSLTREERNEWNRQWRHANLETFRQGRREYYKKNRAKVLEWGRAWRKANGEKLRARDRERYRLAKETKSKLLAAEQRLGAPAQARAGAPGRSVAEGVENRKRQPSREESANDSVAAWKAFRAQQPPHKEADDSIATWKAFTAQQAPEKAADDGVAAWKAFRERQAPEKAVDDSAAKWQEFRERGRLGPEVPGASSEGARGTGGTGRAEDDEDEDEEQRKKRNRSRDYEFEL
jgi:MobA/MobL family